MNRSGKKEIGVGLLGLGTVGSGVYKIITKHAGELAQKTGKELRIARVLVADSGKERDVDVPQEILTENPSAVLSDPEVDIVAEVIGGVDPAKDLMLEAIGRGKSVVTANKEIMASYGQEILRAAEERGVDLFFEASVGGGIPIIQPLKESLVGNKILKVMGVVNGTTNYILTKMSEDGLEFSKALAEAQRLGYAERDPRADVEGEDAAAKIAILASIAFNSRVTYDQVFREGISKVAQADLAYAAEMGLEVKLVAMAKEADGSLDVRVHPLMIPRKHPLAGVKDAYNAIYLEGDSVGDVMFFGAGAGSLPSASAVVGDIVEAARNVGTGRSGLLGCTCYGNLPVKAVEDTVSSYYIRLYAHDRPGVLAQIARSFGDANVSISSMIQKGPRGPEAELVFVTHEVREGDVKRALEDVKELAVVRDVESVIRVEDGHGE